MSIVRHINEQNNTLDCVKIQLTNNFTFLLRLFIRHINEQNKS